MIRSSIKKYSERRTLRKKESEATVDGIEENDDQSNTSNCINNSESSSSDADSDSDSDDTDLISISQSNINMNTDWVSKSIINTQNLDEFL